MNELEFARIEMYRYKKAVTLDKGFVRPHSPAICSVALAIHNKGPITSAINSGLLDLPSYLIKPFLTALIKTPLSYPPFYLFSTSIGRINHIGLPVSMGMARLSLQCSETRPSRHSLADPANTRVLKSLTLNIEKPHRITPTLYP
ncbi:hypothetical protein J6590_009162 [Homalodisca vitripennis]|nr:hypothetical protein J6590_009162 [Homalodisca vitripennis]